MNQFTTRAVECQTSCHSGSFARQARRKAAIHPEEPANKVLRLEQKEKEQMVKFVEEEAEKTVGLQSELARY